MLNFAKALSVAGRASERIVTNRLIAFGQSKEWPFSEYDGEIIEGLPWQAESIDAKQLRRSLEKSDVVLVYQCLHPVGLFAAAHAKLMGKIVVGMDYGAGEHPLVRNSREAGTIFDLFVASSAFNLTSFLNLATPVQLIRGVVDTDYYWPGGGQSVGNGRDVLAAGRLLPHKGFDRIIKALPDGLALTICGSPADGAYVAHLRDLIGRKDVRLVEGDTDEQLRDRMRSAGLFVHASTHSDYRGRHYHKPELLGLAPLEAMSCGTPALVSSAGSLPELACVAGCISFRDDDELKRLLIAHRDGTLCWPAADELHDDVDRTFGLETFGRVLLEKIGRLA